MEGTSLTGSKVAVTGRLASMTHADFESLVVERGGEFLRKPNRATALLIIGQEGWPLDGEGRQTESLARARRIRAIGYPLELLSEEEFFRRLGDGRQDAVRRLCTITQLSRVLGVPGSHIRRWVRAGLIEPEKVVHRLAFFNFGQVASAKSLCDLIASGVSPQRIRESLRELRLWLPDIETPLAQLTTLEESGPLLVRLGGDRLVEPNGQLHFDFDDEPPAGPRLFALSGRTADEWFEDAIALEDVGRPEDACAAYREAIALEPDDPVLHFNLANNLYGQCKLPECAEEFRRAVECDGGYVEAWNNLAIVLGELHETEAAIGAFRQALRLVPHYADAHYNLADLLEQAGREGEAREHWRAYLRFDPASPACDEVRRRLAQGRQAAT